MVGGVLCLSACTESYYVPTPAAPPPPEAREARPDPDEASHGHGHGHDEDSHASVLPSPASRSPELARIVVYEGKSSPRPAIVVGVIDVHTTALNSEGGFDELRRRALALGADAIISAEFHHGDDKEPSHVSGLAIRYRNTVVPPYDVLGQLDIPSSSGDSAAQAAALEELTRRGGAMGADEIVSVEFHHGDEGQPSHLTGTAVRHRGAKQTGTSW